MKYIVALLVLVAGISAEKCSQEEAHACVTGLIESALGVDSDEETCSELENSIKCLRDGINDCPGQSVEVYEALQEFEKVLEENCNTQDETDDEDESDEDESGEDQPDEDTKKCWTENEAYLYECIQQAANQAVAYVKESENTNIDEDALTCSIYALTASCLIERVAEKCGEEAGMLVVEHVVDMPDDIAESCGKTEGFASHALQLLEDKRKK